jgi:hypothetical protein
MVQNNISNSYLASQKGDVYSFAIIVQEILYRKGVFYLTDEDKEINLFKNENFNLDSNHNINDIISSKSIKPLIL